MEVLEFKHNKGDYFILIRTDSIDCSWRRFRSRIDKDGEPFSMSYCKYTSSDFGFLCLNTPDGTIEYGEEMNIWCNCPPVIFETNKYQISIIFPSVDEKPKVVHAKKNIEDFFFYDKDSGTNSKGCKLTGEVSFLNEPGIFKLDFFYLINGQNKHETFTFEIVSPKLDIKNDYKLILADVNKEYENIIFKYLSTTFQQLQDKGHANSDEIWIQRFEEIIDLYIQSINHIIHKPHFKNLAYTNYKHADRIKKWTPRMCEEYIEFQARGKDLLEHHYFGYQETETTINTLENRFVKYSLEQIGKRLEIILEKILNNPRNIKPSTKINDQLSDSKRLQLRGYQTKLRQLRDHSFFKTIGKFEGLKQESLVLQNRTGYVQVYKSWIKLKRGIDLYNGIANIGTLQIWEIYELWCFVKMKKIVAEVMKCRQEDIEEDKDTLLNPFTSSKVEHKVTFHFPRERQTNNYVTLHYQHTYNRFKDTMHTATTEQRPDIVLNIELIDQNITLTYLYDAKYRVADDNDINNDKDSLADYPVPEAINQMHRYRDAIYYGSDYYENIAKEVIGGFILFPGRGNNASIRSRYYWQSIGQVNIGAFPLLPNEENSLLKEHLEDILNNKSKLQQVLTSKPQRGLHYVEANPQSGMILIAAIPDGRKKINEPQDLFDSGKAKIFRTEYNSRSEMDLLSISFFAPIIKDHISGYYEVLAIIPEMYDGKIWIRLELGKYFTVNQLVEIELRGMGDMLITRTIGEFMGDVAEGKIRNAPKNNIFDGYLF